MTTDSITTSIPNEREAFELKYKDFNLTKNKEGDYVDYYVQIRWETWQYQLLRINDLQEKLLRKDSELMELRNTLSDIKNLKQWCSGDLSYKTMVNEVIAMADRSLSTTLTR